MKFEQELQRQISLTKPKSQKGESDVEDKTGEMDTSV